MKTIYVKYYDPYEVMDITPETTDQEIKEACFRAHKYESEAEALWAYAETRCYWSTLLDEEANVQEFIDEAFSHIKACDYQWLEKNFV